MRPGVFLALEGGEGCGKSTQARLLADALKAQDYDVVHTREPGGCGSAELIRELVVKAQPGQFGDEAELLLMLAARAENVRVTVLPALKRGAIVVCDRFLGSTIAYQGYGRHMPLNKITEIHDAVTGSLRPDLTLYISLPSVDVGLQRSAARGGTQLFERMDRMFHKRVAHGFALQARFNRDWRKVSGQGSIEQVHAAVMAEVQAFLASRLEPDTKAQATLP